jgi:flagellar biosynthetic protein FliR
LQLEALTPYLTSFGLVLVRVSSAFFLVPMLGGSAVPLRVRGAFAVAVTIVLTPIVGPLRIEGLLVLLMAAIGELAMGLGIGLVLRIIMLSAEFAGGMAGMQMGFTFSRVVDPLNDESSDIIATALSMVAIVVVLSLNGHHHVIEGLGQSLRQHPPGHVLEQLQHLGTLTPLLSTALVSGMRVAAPVVVTLLLANVAVGLLARTAPQLNLMIMGFAVAILAGLLILARNVGPGFSIFIRDLQRVPEHLQAIVGGM